MPINTLVGTFSIGRDVSVDIVLPSGSHLILDQVTGFDAKPKMKKLSSVGLDGVNRHATIPEGWSLSFDMDRANVVMDDYWSQFEAAYYNGQTVFNATILQTIVEADGSHTQFRFEGVSLSFDDAGNWKSDQYVKQRVSGEASFRKRIQ
jgi:hypothetical protein